MKIAELEDRKKVDEIDLKIIFNQGAPREFTDKFTGKKKMVQGIIVADAESQQGDVTAYFDLMGEDIGKFEHKSLIKVKNAFAKKIPGKEQFRITNAKSIEKIEE